MKGIKNNIKEDEFKKILKPLLGKQEIELHRKLIKRLCDELGISILDYATALTLLNHPSLLVNNQTIESPNIDIEPPIVNKQKVVRYRLDVGRKHTVSVESIQSVLIEVSGVDKNRIGKLEIRNYYSLVDLPEGMPADIFQLLSEVEINQRKLNIKRVKYQPRSYRRNTRK